MLAELIAATDPTDPNSVSPGILGFLVTFALGLATVLLIRNMVFRLRRLRYTPDPTARDDDRRAGTPGSPPGEGTAAEPPATGADPAGHTSGTDPTGHTSAADPTGDPAGGDAAGDVRAGGRDA